MANPLDEFIKDACRAGKTHADIVSVLKEAGWPANQVKEALKSFYDRPFPVAIPLPQLYVSPRFSALNLFFFIMLYFSVWSGISIAFTFLDYYLPDGLGRMKGLYYSTEPIADELRTYLAAAVVCAPMAYFSNRLIRRITLEGRRAVPVIRLRLIYLTLLVAALMVVGNFGFFVYYLLSGELGLRFVIKVAMLAAVSWGVYAYYSPEIRRNEEKG
ncbi:MAG: DUF5671 domain-containing protein [Alphaproteobacteria bacterium]